MKNGLLAFGIVLAFSSTAFSETIAYRQNTTLSVLPNGEGPAIEVGRVTGTYKVGNEAIAFTNGSKLYAASMVSGWRPVLIAGNVQSFHVTPNMILFRAHGNLYKVTDLLGEGDQELIAEDIRDFETINSKVIVRPND